MDVLIKINNIELFFLVSCDVTENRIRLGSPFVEHECIVNVDATIVFILCVPLPGLLRCCRTLRRMHVFSALCWNFKSGGFMRTMDNCSSVAWQARPTSRCWVWEVKSSQVYLYSTFKTTKVDQSAVQIGVHNTNTEIMQKEQKINANNTVQYHIKMLQTSKSNQRPLRTNMSWDVF